jgi:hypothetical protein
MARLSCWCGGGRIEQELDALSGVQENQILKHYILALKTRWLLWYLPCLVTLVILRVYEVFCFFFWTAVGMCAVPRRTCRVRTEMVSNFFSTSNVKAVHFNGPLQDTQNGASTVPERYGTFPFTHWYITNLRCFEAKFWLVLKTKQHIFSCFWILLPNDLEKVKCSPPKNQLLARLHPNSRLWFHISKWNGIPLLQ